MREHEELSRYLGGNATPIDAVKAVAWLTHASECESCAFLLAQHTVHADQLIEVTHDGQPADAGVEQIFAQRETTMRLCAERLVTKLRDRRPRELAVAFNAPLPGYLAVARNRSQQPPALARALLVIAEASLALSSAIGDGIAAEIDLNEGSLTIDDGDRVIGAQYFVGRIAQNACLEEASSRLVWQCLLELIADDDLGIPGIVRTRKKGSAVEIMRQFDYENRILERSADRAPHPVHVEVKEFAAHVSLDRKKDPESY